MHKSNQYTGEAIMLCFKNNYCDNQYIIQDYINISDQFIKANVYHNLEFFESV